MGALCHILECEMEMVQGMLEPVLLGIPWDAAHPSGHQGRCLSDSRTEQAKPTKTSVDIILVSNVQQITHNIGGAASTAHEMFRGQHTDTKGQAYGHRLPAVNQQNRLCRSGLVSHTLHSS